MERATKTVDNVIDRDAADTLPFEAFIRGLQEAGVTDTGTHEKLRSAGLSDDECEKLVNALFRDEDDED